MPAPFDTEIVRVRVPLDASITAAGRAVWDAYGWDDADPATVAEDVILGRLLALNGERADRK